MSHSEHEPSLVCDAMLGSLARWLRLFGYDCTFEADVDDNVLVELARRQGRVLLTRDRELADRFAPSLLVRSTDLESQLVEVLEALGLRPRPGLERSRCSVCNGVLHDLPPDEAARAVPPHVEAERGVRRCTCCGRLYWNASHVARIFARQRRVCARLANGR